MDDTLSNLRLTHKMHAPAPYIASAVNWPPAQERPFFYIGIYTAIALSAGLVNICGVVTQYTGALRASRILFRRLLVTVVRATMRWHDVTPQGRLFVEITIYTHLWRFIRSHAEPFQQGKWYRAYTQSSCNTYLQDVETVDSSLASSLQAVNTALANFAASVITVVYVAQLFFHLLNANRKF